MRVHGLLHPPEGPIALVKAHISFICELGCVSLCLKAEDTEADTHDDDDVTAIPSHHNSVSANEAKPFT